MTVSSIETNNKGRFWTKSWDSGLTDLDPKLFETSFIQSLLPTFETYANKMAFEFEGVEITFGELNRYSNKFAQMLLKQGLKKGDVIGINLANTPQYAIALLGALKIGAVVTGVSPLLSEDQLQYQLHDCAAKGLVTLDAVFEKRLVLIIDKLPDLQVIVATDVIDFLSKIKQILGHAIMKVPKGKVTPIPGKKVIMFMPTIKGNEYPDTLPPLQSTPDDLCYILYTGGTTGAPKGAMLTNRSVVSDLLIVQKWLSWEKGKGVACSGFPFFHVAGLFFCENCLYLGWTQLLVPNPRDTDHICALMKKYQVTCLVNVPSLYQMLLKNPKFKTIDHSHLENCISAAAPFPVESQKELETAVGPGKLLEVYGMTETSPLTTMNPARSKRKLGTIGLPLLNTDIKLRDPATGNEVNMGESGEICVKGPMVMKGYWNKPEETRNVIDKDGYMHTGDVAIFDEEGYLRIVDRTKDMLIVGGYKVFSSKCEDVLVKHPAIDMVALVGIPNPERPGSELVKAYITLKPDYAFDGNEAALKENILNWSKDKLAPYEVPKYLEIRKELPLTIVGKIDKKVLRKEAREAKK